MRRQILVLTHLLAVFMIISTDTFPEIIDPITHDVIPEPDDLLYNRAPDPLPGILPEMLDTGYWISRMKRPDEVILKLDEIRNMNEAYKRRINSPDPFRDVYEDRKPNLIHWWPGYTFTSPDFHTYNPRAVADTVKSRIKDEITYLRKQEYGNCLAIKYSADEINDFEKEMALDKVKDTVIIRDGIAVRTSRLRNIPSFFPEQLGLTQSRKTRWDLWNIGAIKIGRPVTVLHISRSGEYLFVLSEAGYGWVRSEDIAFGNKKDIDTFADAAYFAICTGSKVQFYTDETCTIASGWFGMGTRLPLVSKNNPRMIKVPVRKMNGQFSTETAWLVDNNEFHVGYLPYTRRNIVETAFKLLGDPYDWSGAWFGRQHENTYNDIFACFGFELPNHGTLFTFYNNTSTTVLQPEMGKEQYFKKILENEPFVTIQSCGGHCQLFLGEHNGAPVVFDQHGYGYPDENDVWYEVRRCNIGDLKLPRYFLLREVTFLDLR